MATSGKKEMRQEKDWTFEEIRTLIEEWEKHHCLYNTTMKEYKDRDKKKAALQQIATVLGPDVTGRLIIGTCTLLLPYT